MEVVCRKMQLYCVPFNDSIILFEKSIFWYVVVERSSFIVFSRGILLFTAYSCIAFASEIFSSDPCPPEKIILGGEETASCFL